MQPSSSCSSCGVKGSGIAGSRELQDGRMGEKPGWRLREEEGENWREKGERGSSVLTERPYRDISLQRS
ncbi:uncharacterized [Tachysurus ichikawai]